MKKQGFTLAEILIAMGLVGVIAALTLPTFVTNCRQQANDSKYSSTVTDLENSFANMVVSELVDDFSGTKFYGDMKKENIEKYLKLNGSGTKAQMYTTSVSFKSGANCKTALAIAPSTILELKNGAYFLIVDKATSYIDVNGKDKPNCLEKDLYKISIDDNGLIKKED